MELREQSWFLTAGFFCLVLAFAPSIADGAGTVAFGNMQSIDTVEMASFYVSTTDIDGDGDFDIVAAENWMSDVGWYENLDGKGTFSDAAVILPCCDREAPRCERYDCFCSLSLAVLHRYPFRVRVGTCCLSWSSLSTFCQNYMHRYPTETPQQPRFGGYVTQY